MNKVLTEVGGGSEITLDSSPKSSKVIATVPVNACDANWTFLKRTTGDTIYIGIKGRVPTPQSYDIILTDNIPFFSDKAVIGDIKAVGTLATSILTALVTFNLWQK